MITGDPDQEPILASWKISEVLKKYPHVLEVLIELSPAFSKLRNPVLRKVQTRLVTVAQAAQIAGLAPADLTRTLNRAAGITPAGSVESTSGDQPLIQPADDPSWISTSPVVSEIDVRPAMARGEEPFHAIMSIAKRVSAGSSFRLLAGFEPVPLYDALAKLGFDHSTSRHDDVWEVLFYRVPGTDRGGARQTTELAGAGLDWNAPSTAEVSIDVSELVPPEPMVKILQALESLPPNGRLLVHHVRRPMHLYDRLNEMGYAHDTREPSPGHVEVLIQKTPVATP